MTKIVGVRFQRAGKIYYFDPADLDLDMAMHVIVETARGTEMGTVLIPSKEVEDDSIVAPLKPVLRVATDEDERMAEMNKAKEHEAFEICKEKILKHELDMKLIAAEYTFDGNKLLFYFTADGRIDFRELVKDLASVFRTRIELRQIGVRDETKMMGGIGICGRPLCCSTWLSDFVPVSIKMAKEQSLSLNPTKISGVCGRLMCCLKNEQDTYEYLNSRMPGVGDLVVAADGVRGQVSAVNVLRQTVKIVIDNGDEKEMKEYHVDELRFTARKRKDNKLTEEELAQIAALEALQDVPEKETPRENRRRGKGAPNAPEIEQEPREPRENRRRRDSENGEERRENRRRDSEGGEERDRRDNRRRNRRDGENGEERDRRDNRRRDNEGGEERRDNRRKNRENPRRDRRDNARSQETENAAAVNEQQTAPEGKYQEAGENGSSRPNRNRRHRFSRNRSGSGNEQTPNS